MTMVNLVAGHKLKRVIGRFAVLIACAPAPVLFPVSPALAALSCSAGSFTLDYGSYHVLAYAEVYGCREMHRARGCVLAAN